MSFEAGRDVLLRLRAVGSGPPVPVRLRSLLKTALRTYGLRCLWIGELPEHATVRHLEHCLDTTRRLAAEPIGSVIDRVLRVRLQIKPHREGPMERSVRELVRDCDGLERRAQTLLTVIVDHADSAELAEVV